MFSHISIEKFKVTNSYLPNEGIGSNDSRMPKEWGVVDSEIKGF